MASVSEIGNYVRSHWPLVLHNFIQALWAFGLFYVLLISFCPPMGLGAVTGQFIYAIILAHRGERQEFIHRVERIK